MSLASADLSRRMMPVSAIMPESRGGKERLGRTHRDAKFVAWKIGILETGQYEAATDTSGRIDDRNQPRRHRGYGSAHFAFHTLHL